jgi:predicted lipoprotein with Yx(FWY)xxD motif
LVAQSNCAEFPYIRVDTRDHEETDPMTRTHERGTASWRRSLSRIAAVAVTLGALAVAAAPRMAGAAPSPTATEIASAKYGKLGVVLVAGATPRYTLKAKKTGCDASCRKAQPPVLLPDGVMSATAGSGIDASKLGTVTAANGALQITYAGKPLYWSAKDTSSAKLHGTGTNKWGTWTAVVLSKSSSGGKSTPTTNAGNGGVGF